MQDRLSWHHLDDSHFLFRLSELKAIKTEWHKVGEIQLRQVYPNIPPQYFAWGKDEEFLGRFETLELAREIVMRCVQPLAA